MKKLKIPHPEDCLQKKGITKLEKKNFYLKQIEDRVDHIIFLGDLNYRVELSKKEAINFAANHQYEVK